MLTRLTEADCKLYIKSRREPDFSRFWNPLKIHVALNDNDPDIVAAVLQNPRAAPSVEQLWRRFSYKRVAQYITQISHVLVE